MKNDNPDNICIKAQRKTDGMYEDMIMNFEGGITGQELLARLLNIMRWMTYTDDSILTALNDTAEELEEVMSCRRKNR